MRDFLPPYPYAPGEEISYTLPELGLPRYTLTGRVTLVVADGVWVTYRGTEIKIHWSDIQERKE